MKRLVLNFGLLVLFSVVGSAPTWAAVALDYSRAECSYFVEDKLVETRALSLMALAIGEDSGRFVQVQFGSADAVVQYQLLFENDSKNVGHVLVLQNLLVGDSESSSEFSSRDVSFVRLRQGAHSVSCRPFRDVQIEKGSR